MRDEPARTWFDRSLVLSFGSWGGRFWEETGSPFPAYKNMSLNIIVRKGGGKASDGEVAETLARKIDQDVARHKHQYTARARQIRKEAEQVKGGKGFRPVAVYDAETYARHEQANPGCMSDPEYRRDFLRDNPECRL